MKLVATLDGEKHELGEPQLPDFVWFERHFGISASAMSEEGAARLEHMVFLAHCALRRKGVLPIDDVYNDAFVARLTALDDVEAEGEAEENPTVADQPTG